VKGGQVGPPELSGFCRLHEAFRPDAADIYQHTMSPARPEVAVNCRGYWFSIAADDVQSRTAMAIFEILFAVREAEGRTGGPLLTSPLGAKSPRTGQDEKVRYRRPCGLTRERELDARQ